MIKRTPSEIILLSASALSALLISPLVYFRYITGDMVMAVIDASIIVMLVVFFGFVYKTRKVAATKILLATFLAIAIVSMVILRGQEILYWLYPAILVFYYILPVRTAGLFCLLTITITLVYLFPEYSAIEFFIVTMSLTLISIFSYMIFSSYRKTSEKLTLLATIDPLTLSGNRRALDTKLADVLADQQRQASTMSLLLLDLDLFKKINDEHGHAAGDQILVEAASLLKQHTRALDAVYRYGGEEFIIVPLKADLAAARIIAEKLRSILPTINISRI